ncbi:hypothetical protein GQ43DRAFT_421233 [Delitschia confertaspora ATCC 74209]|uniref:C2H2-type domain-containing protein n=1 Tax=Delitschia confertaspora ATCC 74209 TaxID=1513339 RepID=A0A9P4JKU6_9PLEO|nr:hypothetical protein GQ43DRAFT_421233 [Delitschia confertaspora ATCC 74209]
MAAQEIIQPWQCSTCGKLCERFEILRDHHLARGHCFCTVCGLHFDTHTAFEDHQAGLHASEFKCCDCNITFSDVGTLKGHIASCAHQKPVENPSSHQVSIQQDEENTCKDCEKTFSNREALLQHRQSVKHKPLSDLKCPLGKGCSGRFMTPSALLQHLESGNCHSGMDRHEIFRMVQSCDADHVIHSPSHLHTRNSFRSPDIETPAFPSDGSLSPWSLLETSSMDVDHTGGLQALTELKCSLCPPKRKPFAKAKDLEQHLNSAAHCAKIYHCPSSIFSATNVQKQHVKERQFSTLSGLTQHMENGACNGDKKAFVSSIGIIQRQLKLMGFEGIPLLLPSSRS